jgi:hypothetical protein
VAAVLLNAFFNALGENADAKADAEGVASPQHV